MVAAPVDPAREAGLRELLRTMNLAPGVVDPQNDVLPFSEFENLHYARLALLDDTTLRDRGAFGLPCPQVPLYLAFLGDCDGSGRAQLAAFARRAGEGLRRLFAPCRDCDAGPDLLDGLLPPALPVAVLYVNRIGRTVRQVREESGLQQALSARVPRGAPAAPIDAQAMRRGLVE